MQKWEYLRLGNNFPEYHLSDNSGDKRFKVTRHESSITFINNLGLQGWEMINFQQTEGHVTVYYFKRPLE